MQERQGDRDQEAKLTPEETRFQITQHECHDDMSLRPQKLDWTQNEFRLKPESLQNSRHIR
jgi:hypothetical protein